MNCRSHDGLHLGSYLVVVVAFSAEFSKMFRKGVGSLVASTPVPVIAILTSPGFNNLPYVLDMLHSPLLEVLLSLTVVGFSGDFAVQLVDDHTCPALSLEPAGGICGKSSSVTVAFSLAKVEIEDVSHYFLLQIVVELLAQVGELVVRHGIPQPGESMLVLKALESCADWESPNLAVAYAKPCGSGFIPILLGLGCIIFGGCIVGGTGVLDLLDRIL